MTFVNTGFETGDATPVPPEGAGTGATGWTATYTSTGSAYANFGDATITEGAERFERNWHSNESYLSAFTLASLNIATFSSGGPYTSASEAFESLWSSNEAFLFDLGRQEQMNFGATLLGAEGFDREWSSNENFSWSFADTDLLAGTAEDFESHWRSNEAFVTAFTGGMLTAASFDGSAPQSFEDFEQVDFNLWTVAVSGGLTAVAGEYTISIENADATFVALGSETVDAVGAALFVATQSLGQHFVPKPGVDGADFYLSIDERLASDPSLDLADLLSSAGAIKAAGPGGSHLKLQRVDATTLWTQSGKLFSI